MSHLINSNSPRRFVIVVFAVIAAGGAVVADAQYQTGQVQHGGSSKQCCFNNFRFAGSCAAQVGQNESCNTVLSYLNNFNSVGLAYCGNTTVRGGWTTVDCAAGSSSFEIETNNDLITPHSATQVAQFCRGAVELVTFGPLIQVDVRSSHAAVPPEPITAKLPLEPTDSFISERR